MEYFLERKLRLSKTYWSEQAALRKVEIEQSKDKWAPLKVLETETYIPRKPKGPWAK